MKKMFHAMQQMVKKAHADELGGVSPLVVTIGLALLLLVAIMAFSPTLRGAITNEINTVIANLDSLSH